MSMNTDDDIIIIGGAKSNNDLDELVSDKRSTIYDIIKSVSGSLAEELEKYSLLTILSTYQNFDLSDKDEEIRKLEKIVRRTIATLAGVDEDRIQQKAVEWGIRGRLFGKLYRTSLEKMEEKFAEIGREKLERLFLAFLIKNNTFLPRFDNKSKIMIWSSITLSQIETLFNVAKTIKKRTGVMEASFFFYILTIYNSYLHKLYGIYEQVRQEVKKPTELLIEIEEKKDTPFFISPIAFKIVIDMVSPKDKEEKEKLIRRILDIYYQVFKEAVHFIKYSINLYYYPYYSFNVLGHSINFTKEVKGLPFLGQKLEKENIELFLDACREGVGKISILIVPSTHFLKPYGYDRILFDVFVRGFSSKKAKKYIYKKYPELKLILNKDVLGKDGKIRQKTIIPKVYNHSHLWGALASENINALREIVSSRLD